jgi:hypothetical protein
MDRMKLNFYDFAGVLAPVAVAVYGLARTYPELGQFVRDEKISFGELGLLLILAYVAGHLLQSLGNLIERAFNNPQPLNPSARS